MRPDCRSNLHMLKRKDFIVKNSVKRAFSFVVALLFCICFLVPVASALEDIETPDGGPEGILVGEGAISANVKDYLLKQRITVNDTTTFQLTAPTETSRASRATVKNALVVTNEDDKSHSITKDFILLYGEDGPVEYETLGTDDTHARVASSLDFPASGQMTYIVHGKAFFDGYANGGTYLWIRPLSAEFSYEKLKSCSVTYISVKFITDGFICDYPSFEQSDNPVRWTIDVSQANPAVNRLYSKSLNYPSNKVIGFLAGPLTGAALSFSVTVDGRTEHDVYPFAG